MSHVIRVQNVCQALPAGISHLLAAGVLEETRAGPALVSPGPVVTTTLSPTQRVLFSAARDANPFFHMYESIWMLAGRDDAAPLNHFVRNFGRSYGETGGEVHGAYGRRWRSAFGVDQLDTVVQKLLVDPDSRQAVLQMWDCAPAHDDLTGSWRDRPCNTHVYLRLRREKRLGVAEEGRGMHPIDRVRVLDLTVCCRSNDIVWGAHGANAVHFSVLQEYLAARLGAEVGIMYQLSNNYHAYLRELDKLEQRAEVRTRQLLPNALEDDRYAKMVPMPIFDVPVMVDNDVRHFVRMMDSPHYVHGEAAGAYGNTWFKNTLEPAMHAHALWRAEAHETALRVASSVESPDWRAACTEWLRRRIR